jgi:predicted nucleic acid-binding protein
LAQLVSEVPEESITWVSGEIRRFYPEIMALIRDTSGVLNFHDALIALGCRELGIQLIATFDNDFDYIEWLKRLTLPDDVAQALGPIQ